jgi:hypothetical protein
MKIINQETVNVNVQGLRKPGNLHPGPEVGLWDPPSGGAWSGIAQRAQAFHGYP